MVQKAPVPKRALCGLWGHPAFNSHLLVFAQLLVPAQGQAAGQATVGEMPALGAEAREGSTAIGIAFRGWH